MLWSQYYYVSRFYCGFGNQAQLDELFAWRELPILCDEMCLKCALAVLIPAPILLPLSKVSLPALDADFPYSLEL